MAIKDQNASTVAPLLVNRIICMIFFRFGSSVDLHSDQEANFAMSWELQRRYHTSGDGWVERQNRTLQEMLLVSVVSQHTDDWDVRLDTVTYAYNLSRQESIDLSLYEVSPASCLGCHST